MTDNYKIIRKAKDAALNLKSLGWTHNGIASEMGITFALLNEILDFDPVAVNVRGGTMEKLRAFVDRHEAGLEKPKRKKSEHKKKDPNKKPEFHVQVTESMADAIPDDVGIQIGPNYVDGNLLNELNLLAEKFAKAGYRLNANIEFIYTPG